ncbi:MAG: amidohydrolase [Chloroflexi bacterium]|nr:amidohydrolase [Chloroflexota bacterium]MBU1751041.1 amidohydrolase [Chloroflexota bacterium]
MLHADLVLHNAVCYTMDPALPRAEALAVYGNRIAAVGPTADVLALRGPNTIVIDLRGQAVLPGFIDSHVHLANYALARRWAMLDGLSSLAEVLDAVARRVAITPPGMWVEGFGWNHNVWPERRFPTRHDLDAIAPDHPVALRRKDGHTLWVNTVALARGGLLDVVPEVRGGQFDRDERSEGGALTGIIRELAIDWFKKHVIGPPPLADTLSALVETMPLVHSLGLTSVQTPEEADKLTAWLTLRERGELALRVWAMIEKDDLDAAIGLGLRAGFGDDWVRLGGLKLYADGALGSHTADMLEPYADDPTRRGLTVLDTDELRDLVGRASRAGFPACVHAIGDAAVRRVLDVLAALPSMGEQRLRHRIEHVQVIHPADLGRLTGLGVVAAMQPLHAPSDREVADRLWGSRARYAYAWRSLLDRGTRLAFGSDGPIEDIDPLAGIYATVTRKHPDPTVPQARGEPAEGWYPEECLSVEEAVRAYTLDAAYAAGEEHIKGSLTPGKLADIVVLSRDILSEPPPAILKTRVNMTILDGKVVYER